MARRLVSSQPVRSPSKLLCHVLQYPFAPEQGCAMPLAEELRSHNSTLAVLAICPRRYGDGYGEEEKVS
jgi:hypothetical protein